MFDYEYTGKCFFGNLIMLIVNIKELCLVMQEKKKSIGTRVYETRVPF